MFDCLARDICDPETGEIYPALSCCNDQSMADRCTVIGAPKVIWAIKANSQLNSDCAVLLREGFRSGRIRLLLNEYDGEALFGELRGFNNLNPSEREALILPYYNTTLLITELTALQHDESAGRVKVFEKAGMRKDRYSSLSYNFYIATLVEAKVSKRNYNSMNEKDAFVIKAPKTTRKAVSRSHGRVSTPGWY